MKEALLTVSFGTAVEQARQADICAVERTVAQALPHLPAYQAYTSPTIRRILARRGIDIPGFVPALEQLAQDGVEQVYVLPTHVLPGYEYDDLLEAVEKIRPQFQQLRMAPPLLGDTWGVRALAQILCDRFPRQEGQAVVLLGHGTEHPGNLVYPALQGVLDWLGREDILIGTVEGWPQGGGRAGAAQPPKLPPGTAGSPDAGGGHPRCGGHGRPRTEKLEKPPGGQRL